MTGIDVLLRHLNVTAENAQTQQKPLYKKVENHVRATTLQEGGKPCESNIQQHDKNKKPQKIRQRLVQSAKGKTPSPTDDGYEPKNIAIKTKLHPPQQNIVQ